MIMAHVDTHGVDKKLLSVDTYPLMLKDQRIDFLLRIIIYLIIIIIIVVNCLLKHLLVYTCTFLQHHSFLLMF